jgi:hydrogenase maturation protease
MTKGIVIIGIGNPYRGDDGAGWAAVDRLKKKIGASIPLLKLKGDIAELLDVFGTHERVYLIDAYQADALSDAWRRIDARAEAIPEENPQTSTHGFGIGQAISLARNLSELPQTLIVYAIKGREYTMSDHLSKEVSASVDEVVEAVIKEVRDA